MLRIALRDLQFRSVRFVITIFGTGIQPDDIAALIRDGPTDLTAIVSFGALIDVDGEVRSTHVLAYEVEGAVAPPIEEGRRIEAPGEAVWPAGSGVALGDVVTLGGRELDVVGVSPENVTIYGGIPLIFLHIADGGFGTDGATDFANVYVTNKPVDTPEGLRAWSRDDTINDLLRSLRSTTDMLRFVAVFLWVAAAGLLMMVTYVTALERLRDFAVIKAQGASTASILAGVVAQSVALALLAATAGAIAQALVAPHAPIRIEIPLDTYWQLFGLAALAGVASSLAALRRAASVDPATAFSASG